MSVVIGIIGLVMLILTTSDQPGRQDMGSIDAEVSVSLALLGPILDYTQTRSRKGGGNMDLPISTLILLAIPFAAAF